MAKVLISIDDRLLRRIDRAAKASGLSRSAFLATLAEEHLRKAAGRTDASLKDALARLDRLFEKVPPGDSINEMQAERDSR